MFVFIRVSGMLVFGGILGYWGVLGYVSVTTVVTCRASAWSEDLLT